MEAEFVAQKIQSMLAQGTRIRSKDGSLVPVQPEDIVILLRSPGSAYAMEAEFVAQKIQSMLAQGTRIRSKDGSLVPVQPEDIVILLRSPGSAARYFQQALERRGLRCTSGSGMDLMKTQQISALRSLLQVVLNPRQDIPLIAALASPVFGFVDCRIGKSCVRFYCG